MVKSESQRMAPYTLQHISGGYTIPHPGSTQSFHSQVEDAGRKEKSLEGEKKSDGVWERTKTRVENLVGCILPEILCLFRQSSPSLEMPVKTSWQASGEALRRHRGAVVCAVLDFVQHLLEEEQPGLGYVELIPLGQGNESATSQHLSQLHFL